MHQLENRGRHLRRRCRANRMGLAELERLVSAMEGSQLPLDALLDNYRRGAQLLDLCRARLQAVEQQVKVLEDGELKPWSA